MKEHHPFNQDIADFICDGIADGNSLRSLVEDTDRTPKSYIIVNGKKVSPPTRRAIYNWLAEYPAFQSQYAQARALFADSMIDDIHFIADTEKDSAKARNMIETRKWIAGRMQPGKWGERIQLANAEGDIIEEPISGNPRTELGRRVLRAITKASKELKHARSIAKADDENGA